MNACNLSVFLTHAHLCALGLQVMLLMHDDSFKGLQYAVALADRLPNRR